MPRKPYTANQPWADKPCALIPTPQYQTKQKDIWTKSATHMALLHNAVIRGFNSIYIQAPYLYAYDHADFIDYSLTWYRLVKSHHDDEKAELFPKIEAILDDKTIWADTHKEHESFTKGLEDFHQYLDSLKHPEHFSGKKLVAIMDTFRFPFAEYFHSQVATILSFASHPNSPAPKTPQASAVSSTFKNWTKATLQKGGVWDVLPFALMNMDAKFEEGMWAHWPPMPAPVRWMMVNVVGSWYGKWWRFASCDAQGNPKVLYALKHRKEIEMKEAIEKGEVEQREVADVEETS